MKRRGRPQLKLEAMKIEELRALLEVQRLVNQGVSPNAAAVAIARQRWRSFSPTYGAAHQWLKRNQRTFGPDLNDYVKQRLNHGATVNTSQLLRINAWYPTAVDLAKGLERLRRR
jgi:hypothetical protein